MNSSAFHENYFDAGYVYDKRSGERWLVRSYIFERSIDYYAFKSAAFLRPGGKVCMATSAADLRDLTVMWEQAQ